jgi:PTS system beta-glucosides-specific IIC component
MEGVGGRENIKSLVHCATRLRFTLNDQSKAKDDTVKGTSGVVSVVKAGGLYQVVIGNDVHEVFVELEKLGAPIGASAAGSPSEGDAKCPVTLASIGNGLITTISGVFAPILPGLMGIGMIKGLFALLQVCFPTWAASGDTSFVIMNAAGDTLMYFLPILIAFTAAQKFGLDPILGMVIGGALVYPNIVEMYPFGPWGVHKFFGLDILVMMRYSGTVLPSIFAVYGASKLYQYLRRALPSAVKNFLAPFFTLIITIPLMFLIIGPIFGAVGLGIQNGIQGILAMKFIGPILLGFIVGGFWQVLVIFGLHWALIPIFIQEASQPNPLWGNNGVTVISSYVQFAVIAQLGAVLAMAVKMKNEERRSAAIAAGIGGVFGITEPIIYGFTLPKRKPFFTACFCGAFSAALAALLGNILISDGRGIAQQIGALGIFTYPSYLLPNFPGSTMNFLIALLGTLLSMLITFLVVNSTYQPDAAELRTVATTVIDTSKVNTATAKKIFAPVKGRIMPITQSADPAHQEEAVGKGVCFMPLGGKIFAPFDGVVEMVFDTKHAINIKSKDGVEVLIHCGIDTVKLRGEGFTVHVKDNDKVKAGQLLLEYNKDIIARAGYNLETQVVITNTGDYKAITQAKTGECVVGDLILYVE